MSAAFAGSALASVDCNYVSQFGSSGSATGQFNRPERVAVDSSGNVYVADAYNARVEKFSAPVRI